MARPRKNSITVSEDKEKVIITETSEELKSASSISDNKINIKEVSTISGSPVKFVTGTQQQYDELKSNNFITKKTHIVQRGETLQSISNTYGIPVSKLSSLNGSTEVSVGKKIYLN